MACRLQHIDHQSSQLNAEQTLSPIAAAEGFRMSAARHTAQFGSKGFVS
jgi:hypothetical protein